MGIYCFSCWKKIENDFVNSIDERIFCQRERSRCEFDRVLPSFNTRCVVQIAAVSRTYTPTKSHVRQTPIQLSLSAFKPVVECVHVSRCIDCKLAYRAYECVWLWSDFLRRQTLLVLIFVILLLFFKIQRQVVNRFHFIFCDLFVASFEEQKQNFATKFSQCLNTWRRLFGRRKRNSSIKNQTFKSHFCCAKWP